jgi:hypothetical protein
MKGRWARSTAAASSYMVGRDDGDGVDAVSARRLLFRHVGEGAIAALLCEAEALAEGDGPSRIGLESACNELPSVIEARRHAMDGADEGAFSAADHSKAETSQRSRPSKRRFPNSSVPLAAKSSKARGVTRMMWSRMKAAPSRAPSSGCLMQHNHSRHAQPY